MTRWNLKWAAGFGMAVIFGGFASIAISQTTDGDKLGPVEIAQKSMAAYAALTSYSDEGETRGTVGTVDVSPCTFSTRLGRPNLYRIEWTHNSQTGMVWSAGGGDFLQATHTVMPTKQPNMESALGAATGISADATGTIPMAYFNFQGNSLKTIGQAAQRKPDEKADGVDCYVVVQNTPGGSQTYWIGKKDLLIRKMETNTRADYVKKIMAEEAKKHPELNLPAAPEGDIKSVQKRFKIVVNQTFQKADFAP